MTEGILLLLLILVLVGGVVIVLALALGAERIQGRISLPWNAGILLDTQLRRRDRRPAPPATRSSARASRAWLIAKVWGRRDWQCGLDPRRHTHIGCSRDMDIILNDPAADRQHAVIFWHDGRYWVRNLSRSRGTRVNGQWIREHQLGNGNKIRMGNTELILREQR